MMSPQHSRAHRAPAMITSAIALLSLASPGCIDPAGGDYVPPPAQTNSAPSMTSPPPRGDMATASDDMGTPAREDMGASMASDMPADDMAPAVCARGEARCEGGARVACEDEAQGFTSAPCGPGEQCVGEGSCARACDLDPDVTCELRALRVTHPDYAPGCLGEQMALLGEDLLLIADPCARPVTQGDEAREDGVIHITRVTQDGDLSYIGAITAPDQPGGRLGASLQAFEDGVFIGAPGAQGGGQVRYLQSPVPGSLDELGACEIALDHVEGNASFGERLDLSEEARALAVIDSGFVSQGVPSPALHALIFDAENPCETEHILTTSAIDGTRGGFGVGLDVIAEDVGERALPDGSVVHAYRFTITVGDRRGFLFHEDYPLGEKVYPVTRPLTPIAQRESLGRAVVSAPDALEYVASRPEAAAPGARLELLSSARTVSEPRVLPVNLLTLGAHRLGEYLHKTPRGFIAIAPAGAPGEDDRIIEFTFDARENLWTRSRELTFRLPSQQQPPLADGVGAALITIGPRWYISVTGAIDGGAVYMLDVGEEVTP